MSSQRGAPLGESAASKQCDSSRLNSQAAEIAAALQHCQRHPHHQKPCKIHITAPRALVGLFFFFFFFFGSCSSELCSSMHLDYQKTTIKNNNRVPRHGYLFITIPAPPTSQPTNNRNQFATSHQTKQTTPTPPTGQQTGHFFLGLRGSWGSWRLMKECGSELDVLMSCGAGHLSRPIPGIGLSV